MTDPHQPLAPLPHQTTQPKPARNVVGIIALVLSGVGFVFACIPGWLLLGWILLPISFVLGIIAVCLRGRVKWQGLTAIVVAVIGTIVGVIVFFAVAANAFSTAVGGDDITIGEGSSPVVESPSAGQPAADAPAVASGTRENPVAFGTAITTDAWDFTLVALNADGNTVVAAGNSFNQEPSSGSQYIVVDATATYKGSGEGSSSSIEIDYVTADGTIISTFDTFVSGVDPIFGQASLYAGGADTGKIVFMVPSTLDGLIRVKPGLMAEEVFFSLP